MADSADTNNVSVISPSKTSSKVSNKTAAMSSDDEAANTDVLLSQQKTTGTASTAGLPFSAIPVRSQTRYINTYKRFVRWATKKKLPMLEDATVLGHYQELSKKLKAPHLWSSFWMLKSTVGQNDGVDIGQFPSLMAFLKQQSKIYDNRHSDRFYEEEIARFLLDAPDKQHLLDKVVLVLGISGVLKREQLFYMKLSDLRDLGYAYVVQVQQGEHRKRHWRSFEVHDEFYRICRRFVALRPEGGTCEHVLLKYKNGVCYDQPTSLACIGKKSREIAEFLDLENPENYIGQVFGRSNETLVVERGSKLTTLSRDAVWEMRPSNTCLKVGPQAIGQQ